MENIIAITYMIVVVVETCILCKLMKDEIGLSPFFFLLALLISSTVFVLPIFAVVSWIQNLFQK